MAKLRKHSCGPTRREFLTLAGAGVVSVIADLPECKGESAAGLPVQANVPKPIAVGGIAPEYFDKARKRATEIVSKLTLEEKIPQFSSTAPAVPRVGLPAFKYYGSEALHGLIHDGPVTSFPLPLALGCTWNRALIEQVFTAVSDEIWAWHKKDGQSLAMFSPPTVNMGTRDPRWGRIGENYSEDPELVGQLAIHTVYGMQGHDSRYLKTIACAKHFIANDTENDREITSATVDPRSFWEYYSRGFEACVKEGHVFTVMSSYNRMNGIPTSANRFLLTDLLRKQWGFQGYVVSDCDAIEDIFDSHHFVASYTEAAALALNAGSSINCGETLHKYLGNAVDGMLVDESALDEALIRAITGRVLLGEFDPPEQNPYSAILVSCLESSEHLRLAREAACQSIVLFKNEKNTLPLERSRIRKVAVIGPMADVCELGNYSGSPKRRVSPLQGIREYLGVASRSSRHQNARDAIKTSDQLKFNGGSEGSDILDNIFNGSWAAFSGVLFDGVTKFHARVASLTAGGTIEVHLDSLDGPLVSKLNVPNTGAWENWVNVSGPIEAIHGEHTVFLSFVGGSERLFVFESFRLTPEQPFADQAGAAARVAYALGCTVRGEKDPTLFDEAVAVAREADVALIFVGADEQIDSEGKDRTDINLPGTQHDLVRAVFEANPRTILVVSSNCPVALNWEEDNLPAIVGGIFLGVEQGHALADVLFGKYTPGGKLSTTWYRGVEDLPDYHDYNIRHGRTYMYFNGMPLYPFGHGLSYTSFLYKNLSLSSDTLHPGSKVVVAFDLTNSGDREGDEIIQLYVHFPESKITRPYKQLANFERIHLKAGETKTCSLELSYEHQSLCYWDEAKSGFAVETGSMEVMIGSSSQDIKLREQLQLQG